MAKTIRYEDVVEALREGIEQITGIKINLIQPDSDLQTHLGIDSLCLVELEHHTEKQLGILLPDDYLERTLQTKNLISHGGRAHPFALKDMAKAIYQSLN